MTSVADPRWEAGPRVRIDKMRLGSRFVSKYSGTWRLAREHASRGVFYAVTDDGHEDVFAGCAEGVVVNDIGRPVSG